MRRPYWIALTVLALGGLVIGLLLPAVYRVREAAARVTCLSNFKGLAVALHGYAETFPFARSGLDRPRPAYPAGTVPNAELPSERQLSWYVPLMPHMYSEQDKVFKRFDLSAAADGERNRSAGNHRFRHFVCPSSGEYLGQEKWKSPTPLTHYVGVAGVGSDAATLSAGHPRAGAFGYDRRTALDDISDGTSNTFLVIETSQNPGHWAFGGSATVRGIEPDATPHVGPGRPFGGFHDGGWNWFRERKPLCNAAMADGSVRSFTSAVSPEVLAALATVAGKEQLPANW